MAFVKDFAEGAMSKTLVSRGAQTGLYRVVYVGGAEGEIQTYNVNVPQVILEVYCEFITGQNKTQTKENLAKAILREIGAKSDDKNVYFAAHINEEGMAPVTIFITLEDDNAKRFMKGNEWRKYV